MKILTTLLVTGLFVALTLTFSRLSEGFDNQAHLRLSGRATTVSNLDNFLRTVLPLEFSLGILQSGLAGKTVTELIQDGALLEDSLAMRRVRNHFHNPKLSWDQAGLRPPGSAIPIGQSSVVWSQNINQGDGGKASWHQARDAYFKALTETEPFARKVRWAETFRLLGHAIHHVQDAAVPSHTRNDSHLSFIDSDPFHSFAERANILALINTIPASTLDPSFLSNQASSDSRYPVPISRLLDTNAGDIGALALGNGAGLGIAEYSNANFFIDNSFFPETFPYPGLANLQLSAPEADPATGKKKTYFFFKPGFGETNYRLAQGSSLRNITGTSVPTDIGLDEKVFIDYAYKLFPRAVGYSAGLIDYFFRGGISAWAGDLGCSWPQGGPPTQPSVEMVVSNEGPEGEETGAGQVDFIVHYEVGGVKHYFPLVSQSVFLERDQVTRFMFSTAPLNAVPTNAVNVFMIVVYRGPLGQETDAVIGGVGYLWVLC
jgi:hypothetical protein